MTMGFCFSLPNPKTYFVLNLPCLFVAILALFLLTQFYRNTMFDVLHKERVLFVAFDGYVQFDRVQLDAGISFTISSSQTYNK